MRSPIRYLAGNLAWTMTGPVWATWQVLPRSYHHAGRTAKRDLLDATEAMLKGLPAESLLLSLCPRTDAADVVRRMIDGVPLADCPDWVQACEATLDSLERMALHERAHWLSVPLPTLTKSQRAGAIKDSAMAAVIAAFGIAPNPPGRAEVRSYLAAARQLRATLPGTVQLREATPAELFWMHARAARRSLDEPPLPRAEQAAPRTGLALVNETVFDEGAKTDPDSANSGPFDRRLLKVMTERGASYQAMLTLAEMPDAFAFPGSEWLANLDDFGLPIDWAARIRSVPAAEAEARSRRQARELAEQVGEYSNETAGVPAALQEARASLDDYRARLQASASEVELQVSVVLCVSADQRTDAEAQAEAVRKAYAANDYQLARPLGDQLSLYTAMLPGYQTPRVIRDYVQYLLARDFAMSMPWTGGQLGDPTGGLLGFSLGGSGIRPVLVDPTYGPRVNASASAGWVGELGAGKSVAMKVFMWLLLARDPHARALVVDRTPVEEWVRFAQACPGATQVIRISDRAEVNLDPLRIFPPSRSARYTESFLTLLLGTAPMEVEGIVLAEAIATVVNQPCRSMTALVAELDRRAAANEPAAADLSRKLRVVATKDLARVLFDADLPPLRLADVAAGGAASVVFATAGLMLPSKDELSVEYRFKRLEFEKVFGRACLYLIAALCREVSFADRGRFVGVFFDECWWLTSSVEGQELLLEQIRDGRKHFAGAFLGSHDPADFGNETIRGLLSHRFLFRHRSPTLASRGLEFLGLDATEPGLVDLVTKELSPVHGNPVERERRAGECLYRHLTGSVDQVKILLPPVPRIAEAITTTPVEAGFGLVEHA
ncbi:MAG: ATP-binding protein [Sporichthyaceae bacterium]|nr:ATP-binding protein [Sporichthyaceae bacterium]